MRLKFGECELPDIRRCTLGEVRFWSGNKTFSQISLSRFSKDEQFFVLRFHQCEHKCNPFSVDAVGGKWQVQREKFMKKGASAFSPCRQVTLTVRWYSTHWYSWVERGTVGVKFLRKNTTHCTQNEDHSIELFHTRKKPPYWFTQTKDDFCIKIEFNSQRTGLEHQYGGRDVTLKRSTDGLG